ncbi:hypothetical protein FIV42_26570 [Persicimonas caeni]|uniref:Uncharacterized protein n=1 Tax=Persicimonas caeni TaxID=2292766 RepID=A0A4Y6Q1X4_PERCE|nr:hypothetical protein [Persicimonas caeni]QDG54177.1 hypothetical protein FIV42_26570 [Persicimonas caeni]QED35398.1 hypothetical protein FRD00_26565 [Persicimonas caeni]
MVVEKEPEAKAQVVEFKESPQTDGTTQQHSQVVRSTSEPAQAEPSSPCGVDTFTITRYSPEGRVAKTIDCVERRVVNVKREPMGHSQLVEARQAGLPEGNWYLLVDPKGLRAKYLSNAELIKISKQFDVEYVGKDRQRNLAIYEYRDVVR